MVASMPEPVVNQTSATGRLFRLLKEASLLKGETIFLDVWPQVFKVVPPDRAVGFALYGDIIGLLQEAKAEVLANPDLKQELYLGTITRIETLLLSANPTAAWSNVTGQLQGPNLIALEFCADTLDRLSGEQEIKEEFLDELKAEIERLTGAILASDVEPELKQLLSDKLDQMRQAVLKYRIHGIEGLRVAVEASVGAVVLAGNSQKNEPRRKVIADFLEIVSKALLIVEQARKYLPLAGPAIRALLGQPPRP